MTTPETGSALEPAELAQTYAEIARRSSGLLTRFIANHAAGGVPAYGDELGIAKAFYELMGKLAADPAKLAGMQFKLWQDYLSLWQH